MKLSKNLIRLGAASTAVVAASATPALAQTTGTGPDLTAISDAFVDGMTSGIGLLMVFAPTVVLFAVVWMLIKRASSLAKAG